jgi:hypothetical protein
MKRKVRQMGSEVARIRQEIERECQAMHRMREFACVAKHETLTTRMLRLDDYQQALEPLIGKQEAIATCCQIYIEIMG